VFEMSQEKSQAERVRGIPPFKSEKWATRLSGILNDGALTDGSKAR
jgi:hypothetical protein